MLSREIYELEREKIFRRSWLMVGRVEEIPDPGDYFVKDLSVASASVIVVHSADGKIRGFHNVCRHRGSRVAEGGGNVKTFACPFHGWV